MGKLLSILLPTSNRGAILCKSLPLLAEQIKRNKDLVELIICDNASSDDSLKILRSMQDQDHFFEIKRYTEREDDVGASIARCADNGTGEYINFWSDDDIPSPFMVDAMLNVLRNHPNVACVMMNRMEGYSPSGHLIPLLPINGVGVLNRTYTGEEICYTSAEDFIYAHARHFGFIGNFVVRRSAWNKGMQYYSREHLGYQFQAPLLCGLHGCECVYLNYPLLIQRQIKPRYINQWPLYLYVGYARVCKAIERAGVVRDWRKIYNGYRFVGSLHRDFWNVTHICIPNRTIYLPYVDEMISNQTSKLTKVVFSLIRVPAWLSCVPKFLFWLTMSSLLGCISRKIVRRIIR